jgi:pimeloyl-ACP methyl ester carboxylesterase
MLLAMLQRPVQKRYVETARGLVHVQEAASAAGPGAPTLVLVTPTSFASPLLDTVLPGLASRGWHAVALDLMGYGRSDKRQGHWRVQDFADNVIDATAACGVAPFGLVCGHFSCWPGIDILARRPAVWPGLRGLVLDGAPRYTAEQRAQMLADGPPPPQPWDEQGTHALAYWNKVWRILHRLTPDVPLDAVPTQRFREAVMCLLEASVYEPNTAVAGAHFTLEDKLPLVDLPTLVMCSDTDWNLPHFDAIVAALPQPRPLRLPGVNPLHDIGAPQRGVEYAAHLHGFFSSL